MIDRIFRFALQTLLVSFILVVITSIVFVVDGLRDVEGHADVAVVPGHAELERGDPWAVVQPRVDRVIQLYRANVCPMIIVSGSDKNGYNEVGKMIQYLEGQGVPSSAIIGDEEGIDTRKMALQWVEIMKAQNFNSVMIVTDYYQVTRLKLALRQ
jgi:vancomycin permeability regulator SanA